MTRTEITPKILENHIKNTKEHIRLVNTYAAKIGRHFENHDQKKLIEPDRSIYAILYWKYEHPEFIPTKDDIDAIDQATYQHMT